MTSMKAQRKRRAAEARQKKEEQTAAIAAVAAAEAAAAAEAEALAAAEAEAVEAAAQKAKEEAEATAAVTAATEAGATAVDSTDVAEAALPSAVEDAAPTAVSTTTTSPIIVEVERQKLDFSGSREMFFSTSEVLLTVSDLSVTRQGAPALDNHEAWLEVGIGAVTRLSSVTSARVRKRGGLRWIWHDELQLHVPRTETVTTVQFCSNAHASADAFVTHEIGLASLRLGEPIHIVLVDNAETKVRATLLLTKETKQRLHEMHKKRGVADAVHATTGAAVVTDGEAPRDAAVPAEGAVAEPAATLKNDPEQRSTTVRHQFLELKNRERASALIVPRLNEQQLPYRLHDVPVADFQRFIVHQFAIDLINHGRPTAT